MLKIELKERKTAEDLVKMLNEADSSGGEISPDGDVLIPD
jgi:hypothetical protein